MNVFFSPNLHGIACNSLRSEILYIFDSKHGMKREFFQFVSSFLDSCKKISFSTLEMNFSYSFHFSTEFFASMIFSISFQFLQG